MFGGLWDSFIRFKAAQGVSERTLSDLAFAPEDLHREHEKASPLESLAGAPPRRRYRAR